MIGVIFSFGSETIEVRVDGECIYFRTQHSGGFTTIDGLKLNKAGVIKEFPDLENNINWQKIAKERFKEKIYSFDTEKERVDYIIQDLQKYGYKPMYIQKKGHRTERIK